MKNLDSRIALVTGASRGIGAAVARQLAADGFTVAINYRQGMAEASCLERCAVAASR